MCAVSMIYDRYGQGGAWWPTIPAPTITPNPFIRPEPAPWTPPGTPWKPPVAPSTPYNGPTKEQFQELIELLRAAKRFDEKTGQPNCEDPKKKGMLSALAQQLGVEWPKDL